MLFFNLTKKEWKTKRIIIIFLIFTFIFLLTSWPLFAEEKEFNENDAHENVNMGIDYCKRAESVWSGYKIDEYCRKAIKFFRKALRVGGLAKQELTNAYINQGTCYGYMRYYSEAAENFSKALKIDPKNILALLNRAINYANTGQKVKAMEDLEKVIELDSHSPQGEFAQKAEKIMDYL